VSGNIRAALRKRYAPPAWSFMEEVGNAAGHAKSRSADAIAMSVWPSRGLELHGFEIKVSRKDWLTELKNPAKADPIAAYCDRWWIVVDSDTIVRDGELPRTWGLLVLRNGTLVTVREAEKRKPKVMDRSFLAVLLRKATEYRETMVPREEVNAMVAEKVETSLAASLAASAPAAADAVRVLGLAEKQLGVKFYEHRLPNIRKALDLMTDARILNFWLANIETAAKHAASAGKDLAALAERARSELGKPEEDPKEE